MKRTEMRRTRKRLGEGAARRLVYARSGGICERCCHAPGAEWQHRKNRSQGGRWTAANGLHLCSPCHRYVTEHPADAQANGWSVTRLCDPAAVAVLIEGGSRWVYLTDDGAVTTEPPEASA